MGNMRQLMGLSAMLAGAELLGCAEDLTDEEAVERHIEAYLELACVRNIEVKRVWLDTVVTVWVWDYRSSFQIDIFERNMGWWSGRVDELMETAIKMCCDALNARHWRCRDAWGPGGEALP